jgi:ABC-type multidrug transport system fused ATPase/permease subunit
MYKYIKIFFSTLDKNYTKELILVFLMIFLSVFFDLVGIGMIIPLVNLLLDNEVSSKFGFLNPIIEFLGNPGKKDLLVYFVIFFLIMFLIKNIFLAILTWKKSYFTFSIANFYAKKLLNNYLNKPYSFHINNNSSKLINNLINETSLASGQFILSLIDLVLESLILLTLFMLLLFVEPQITLIMSIIFLSCGSLYFILIKKRVLKFGYLRQITNNERLKLYNEALLNIKFHLIYKKTKKMINGIFNNLDRIKLLNTEYIFLQNLPRLLFEYLIILIFCGVIMAYTLSNNQSIENLVPSLALFSAASFRMLPSANKIIQRLQNLRYSRSAIELIYNELNDNTSKKPEKNKDVNLTFEKLTFKNVSFRYESKKDYLLEDISFNIEKDKIYGFIGATGSGKTTLTDLIMGLQKIDKGQIILNDNINLFEYKFSWQKLISYVPQKIFLQDDTIKNNIAFGEFEDEINEENFLSSIKSAQLEKFISNLEDGCDTKIGEAGSKLSGGQIQRMGIARALYVDPKILIFDEITSSIDVDTERQILEVVKKLKKNKTIILITHKPSTLEICDEVYEVKNQKVIKRQSK